jgi:hypothetical protein
MTAGEFRKRMDNYVNYEQAYKEYRRFLDICGMVENSKSTLKIADFRGDYEYISFVLNIYDDDELEVWKQLKGQMLKLLRGRYVRWCKELDIVLLSEGQVKAGEQS